MTGEGATLLEGLARRYRRRRAAALTAAAAAFGLLTGAATGVGGAGGGFAAVAGAVAAIVGGAAAWTAVRRHPVDAVAVARHVDRVEPAAEESTELLLAPAEALPTALRIQRSRAGQALANREAIDLPDGTARRGALAAGAMTVTAVALLIGATGRVGGVVHFPASAASAAPGRAPAIRGAAVTVRPPSYTGRPARSGSDWEIDAEEGARVEWTVELDRPAELVRLATTAGDTVRLRSNGADGYRGALTARRNALYQVVVADGPDTVAGDFHRLTVRPDAPPTLVVVRPEPRTEIAAGAPTSVALEVLAGDDYGIASAAIVATVTTGEGEGVRFREQRLEFESRTPRPGGLVLRRTLDLSALGMAPGDDLYFHVVAKDRRAPTPNEGRSETVFISLADTAGTSGTLAAGVAIAVAPEYFRSQRQIIIDTEKLIAERRSLRLQVFRDRGNGIGIDQGLLRLRYGQFTGEEFEEGGADDAGHEHDTAENTTLLAESVKSKLKAAIAQMWEAELRLRTYRPSEALPFEYRALELLKQVQQDARVYVERVGFEPPPLEPDRKRLTGKLDAIRDRRVTDSVAVSPPLPAVREGLSVIRALADGRTARAGDAAAVERAGAEVATLAVDDPGRHLRGLGDLRALADSLRRGVQCAECLTRGERALLRALPATGAAAAARPYLSPMARRYFELLERGR